MGALGDPFKLFGRLLLASFKITGYTTIFIVQIIWYASLGHKDRIADAFGFFGKSITDAIGDVFR